MNQATNMPAYKSPYTKHWNKTKKHKIYSTALDPYTSLLGTWKVWKVWKDMEEFNQRAMQGFIVLNYMTLTISTRNIKRRDSPLCAKIIINSCIKSQASCWSLNTVQESHRY